MSTVRKPRGSNVGSCSNARKEISANSHVDDVIVLGQKLKLSSRISRVSFGKRP